MPRVAVAAVSREAADAGVRMAEQGGGAVDAALSAALLAVITHPGMCSLGGACFVTVWPSDGEEPVTVEGAHEMPGRGLPASRFGRGGTEVELDFAGGVRTVVGPASVATPGLPAAFQEAADRFGALPWETLLAPAVERARRGFPMPAACLVFLSHAHEAIYGRDPRSRRALHDESGRLVEAGERIRVEGLADTLETLAREGADALYRGEIGRRVARHVRSEGGLLGRRDLAAYRPRIRRPLRASLDEWSVATNPPPAVGGGVLAASLALLPDTPRDGWSSADVRRLADALEAVGRFRDRDVVPSDDPGRAIRRLLERTEAADGDPARLSGPSSTIHTSAVDVDGVACSVTCSDGYGSGVMPPGTGLWLNNALGEVELSGGAFHAPEPGERLTSNMAPTAARRPDGAVLAVGSPGADRIPAAILQALLTYARTDPGLEGAVEHPRLHVHTAGENAAVIAEPGLALDRIDRPVRVLDEKSLTFGGVEAAVGLPGGRLEAAADSRRSGGVAFGG